MTPDDAPAQAASIIRTTQLEQLLLYLQGVAAPHCQTFFFVRRHKYIHSCKPAGGAHSTPRLWCTLQVTFLTRCFSADMPVCSTVSTAAALLQRLCGSFICRPLHLPRAQAAAESAGGRQLLALQPSGTSGSPAGSWPAQLSSHYLNGAHAAWQ